MKTASYRRASPLRRSLTPLDKNLGHHVVRGASFTFLGIGLRIAITLMSTALLARLLKPSDFGHVVMAAMVTDLASLFANFGFGSILIQRKRINRLQIDTTFWTSILLGVALSLAVFVSSFFTQAVFDDAFVGQLLRVSCLSFILEELTVVPRSLMSRLMAFRTDFAIQAATLIGRTALAVELALHGFGAWSLVLGSLGGQAIQALLYLLAVRYRPRLRWNLSFLRSTLGVNSGYFGNGILFYINSNIDLYLIGRRLGTTDLGYYQNARTINDEIRARMAQPLQRVLFPAFSAIQDDRQRFQDAILRSGRLLALVLVPVSVGVAAVAPEFVKLVYGWQWLAMIPALSVLSIGVGVGAVTTVAQPIYNATNRVQLSFKLYLIQTLLTVTCLAVGSSWGLMGVAYARLGLVLVALAFFRAALGLIGLGSRHIVHMLGAPLSAAALMFGMITWVRPWVEDCFENTLPRLVTLSVLGALVYIAGMLAGAPRHRDDALDVAKKLRGIKAA